MDLLRRLHGLAVDVVGDRAAAGHGELVDVGQGNGAGPEPARHRPEGVAGQVRGAELADEEKPEVAAGSARGTQAQAPAD